MLFFDVFENYTRLFFVLAAFIGLFTAVKSADDLKIRKGLFFATSALLCIFITSALQNFSSFFYAQAVSAKVLAFTEMLFILSATLLLILASVWILFHDILGTLYIISLISLGLSFTIYAIFIANDANILNQLRLLPPIIGMGCLALSFAAQPQILKHNAMLCASIICIAFIGLMLSSVIGKPNCPWFISVDLTIGLAFCVYVMAAQDLKDKFYRMTESQKRTAANIKNIIQSSPFPILLTGLNDDRLILANRNAVKLFRLNENELARYHFKDFFVDTDNRHLFFERLEKKQEIQDFEILVKAASANIPFWLLASANVIDYDNGVVLYTAFQNITDRKRREDMLQNQADRDPLTAVFNRRYFEDNVPAKINLSRQNKQPFAILMLDADHFKSVNDTFGHKIGDKVLIELAAVCERTLRTGDMVARYGGEEFVIFLENVTPDIAELVANRLREAIAGSVVYAENNEPVHFSVSIGIAPSHLSDNLGVMIKMADDAMYLAKQKGRNRVEIYDSEIIQKVNSTHLTSSGKEEKHPVYINEDNIEISLLDGIESQHIMED